ncbi:hypothetical protein EOC93_32170 [Mesorhizobium sp. M6A.T.Ce.TU.002.03.1.1]|uniref:hypothetical protein n=1 Tax=unclassified Mesorhizobium TaxID=325217 RepID=UPI000FCC0049|nr:MULTISPECIES: hypothetical protein [unclassified Mesorhizobium]RUU31150.1 hypothetical protein EOC93_32170 [Mesorhizobium sp. M6A.T.Ce.TU.002.03.1.1]RWN35761.1 MAG: hypothetical protein EOR95_12215 [Mesorhizobium sp.]RWO99836.1 MAG: hypothetical protein EOQ98_11170 [Mesorhizobium sp.]TIT40464.1 MAG: hypothetical protein E5W78_03475 [Mesorhizobium sp.]
MGEILTLEHDPERWESVFGQDHAQQRTIPIRLVLPNRALFQRFMKQYSSPASKGAIVFNRALKRRRYLLPLALLF